MFFFSYASLTFIYSHVDLKALKYLQFFLDQNFIKNMDPIAQAAVTGIDAEKGIPRVKAKIILLHIIIFYNY